MTAPLTKRHKLFLMLTMLKMERNMYAHWRRDAFKSEDYMIVRNYLDQSFFHYKRFHQFLKEIRDGSYQLRFEL